MSVAQETPYERHVLPFVRPFTEALVASLSNGPFDSAWDGRSACLSDGRTEGPALRIGRLLDHGAGTGEVAMAVARAHHVDEIVALDPSPAMCARARELLATHAGSSVHEGTLASWRASAPATVAGDPSSAFDVVTSQLVLMFVDDPAREL